MLNSDTKDLMFCYKQKLIIIEDTDKPVCKLMIESHLMITNITNENSSTKTQFRFSCQ